MIDRFKFRVWDNIHKRYIYCDFAGYCSVDYSGNGEKRIVFMPSGVEQIKNGRPLLYAKEDEAKIEQCTGLKDKNGKLIYEGDIVLKSDVNAIGYSRTRVCKVHWHNDWLSWAITTQYGDTYELSEFEPQQYEIIGNIHENTDLLEVNND